MEKHGLDVEDLDEKDFAKNPIHNSQENPPIVFSTFASRISFMNSLL